MVGQLVSLLMGSTLRYGWSVGYFADGQHTEVWLVSLLLSQVPVDCDFGSAFSCAGSGPDCMCSVFRLKTNCFTNRYDWGCQCLVHASDHCGWYEIVCRHTGIAYKPLSFQSRMLHFSHLPEKNWMRRPCHFAASPGSVRYFLRTTLLVVRW